MKLQILIALFLTSSAVSARAHENQRRGGILKPITITVYKTKYVTSTFTKCTTIITKTKGTTTTTETITLPGGTETETETLPAVTETETETLPPVTETETETLPPVTETETETLPPVTETETETETETPPPVTETETETETETLPPVTETETETETETLPPVTETETETLPPVTETETETLPAVTETETETLPAVTETETETLPAVTETETETLPAVTETETLPAVTETETETLPAVTTTVSECPSCATVSLVNPGFEVAPTDIPTTTTAQGWFRASNSNSAAATMIAGAAHGGSKFLRVAKSHGQGQWSYTLAQKLVLCPNKVYQLKAWVYASYSYCKVSFSVGTTVVIAPTSASTGSWPVAPLSGTWTSPATIVDPTYLFITFECPHGDKTMSLDDVTWTTT